MSFSLHHDLKRCARAKQTPHYNMEYYQAAGQVRLGEETPELYMPMLGRLSSKGRHVKQITLDHHSLHVIEGGEGVFAVGGKSYMVRSGDLFAFFPGCRYEYHDFPDRPWRYQWLVLEGTRVGAALERAGITPDTPLLRADVARRLKGLLQEFSTLFARPTISSTFTISAAWRLVDALAEMNPAATESQNIAEAARFLIDHHDNGILTVDDLAEQLGVNRSALSRQFRQLYNISPKEHLDAIRIERAQRMLRQTAGSLKEIANACGYSSAHCFSQAFRRHCGTSPGSWRHAQAQRPKVATINCGDCGGTLG